MDVENLIEVFLSDLNLILFLDEGRWMTTDERNLLIDNIWTAIPEELVFRDSEEYDDEEENTEEIPIDIDNKSEAK